MKEHCWFPAHSEEKPPPSPKIKPCPQNTLRGAPSADIILREYIAISLASGNNWAARGRASSAVKGTQLNIRHNTHIRRALTHQTWITVDSGVQANSLGIHRQSQADMGIYLQSQRDTGAKRYHRAQNRKRTRASTPQCAEPITLEKTNIAFVMSEPYKQQANI